MDHITTMTNEQFSQLMQTIDRTVLLYGSAIVGCLIFLCFAAYHTVESLHKLESKK